MTCKNCGTECADGVKFCVACGAPMEAPVAAQPVAEPVTAQPVNAQPEKKQTNVLAIISLVTGILSLLSALCCSLFFFGASSVVPGVASIILAILSKKKGKRV